MENLKTWAIVYGSFEAIHCWPDAPSSVFYLKNLHRHLFTVEVWIEQTHNDRCIEYYLFKGWLKEQLDSMYHPESHSCEMYCDDIAELIGQSYPDRDLKVVVREDGLEGACKEYGN